MQYNFSSSIFLFLSFFQRIFRASVTFPTNCFCSFFVRFSINFYFISHHKCRVKTQSKVSDNASIGIFIFFYKLFCSRECYLIDVFFNFISSHSNSLVNNSNFFFFLINFYFNHWITDITLNFAKRRKMF